MFKLVAANIDIASTFFKTQLDVPLHGTNSNHLHLLNDKLHSVLLRQHQMQEFCTCVTQ